MKQLLLLLGFFTLLFTKLYAQENLKNVKGCAFYNDVEHSSIFVTKCTNKEILKIINDILSAISNKSNFEVFEANIQNAIATKYLGRNLIIIDPQFFNQLKQKFGNNETLYFIIAHEIGHHLKNHLEKPSKIHPMWDEIEADNFAGFTMRKLKLDPSTFFDIIDLIAPTFPPLESTHPSWQARMKASINGYMNSFLIETKKGINIPKSASITEVRSQQRLQEIELENLLISKIYNKFKTKKNFQIKVNNGLIYRSYLNQESEGSEFKLKNDTINIGKVSEIYLLWDDPGEICFREGKKETFYFLQDPTIAKQLDKDWGWYIDFTESIQDDFQILMNLCGRIANIQGMMTYK